MKRLVLPLAALTLLAGQPAFAQPSPTPALDVIPEKMPFDIPYGTPITLERAQTILAAVVAEAKNA